MTVAVVAGPAGSGKTARLVCAYRQLVGEEPFGSVLWISPTHRAASDVAVRLVDEGFAGCLAPHLLTFEQLATRVLAAAALRLRPLSPALTRALLGRLIRDAQARGELAYFGPIADTPGFLDLVVGYIRELKRLEIWPEELAAAEGPRAAAKNRELCRLYADYQQLLTRHDLYDRQGQFWAARELLRKDQWGPLSGVRHVLVDGFSDFTRTEHEVLELLAHRTRSITIGLTLDEAAGREELFTKTTATLAALEERHPQLVIERLPRASGTVPALRHLERHLFGNPREAPPVPDSAGIEIIAAAGVTHEVELVAERIKGLLVGSATARPVPAAEVLVVFRSLADVATLVRDVFGRFGIPCVVASPPALGSSPAVSALLSWLRLDVEHWPFREVLGAIGHNLFQPEWPQWQRGRAAAALELAVRELEIPAGLQALAGGIERLARWAAEGLAAKRRVSRGAFAAQQAGPLLARLAATFEKLPKQATAGEWARALNDFARELGLFAALAKHPDGEAAALADRQSFDHLLATLAEIDRLAGWMGEPAGVFSREEILRTLEDLARTEETPLARDETGCVRVLAAESARNLSAEYVFVCGLSEKAFPPAQRDDCLTSDADARRLIAAGLPVASHALRTRYEMLLFYEIATRATRRLVLSYPALDASAQPLVASPYLGEVERACGGVGRIVKNAEPHLSCVPETDDVRSLRDLRVRAIARAREGSDKLLEELCALPETRGAATNILAGLEMSATRFAQREFGPFDGMLTSPAAQQKLAERYGPERCWSPSQLEKYGSCPFKFLLSSVLRVEELGEAELAVDHLERGRLVHDLLATAHRTLNEREGLQMPAAREEAFQEIVDREIAELRRQAEGGGLAGGMAEIDVRKIVSWIERYRRQHAQYDAQWSDWPVPLRPAHFEVSFGPPHREETGDAPAVLPDDCDPLSTLEPLVMDCAGERIRFAGRIDRIDLGEVAGELVFAVVDYKSGARSDATKIEAVLNQQSFQPSLYALAAERLLLEQGARPFRAAYWHLSGKGYEEKHALKFLEFDNERRLRISEQWEALQAALGARIRSLVEGIRRGEFPVYSSDEKCTSFCEFRTVCRINQVRSLEKAWQPPACGGPVP